MALDMALRIDDSYVKTMAKKYKIWAEDLEKFYDNYIKIMHEVTNDGITHGEASKAIKTFVTHAEQIKGEIENLGENARVMCMNYLKDLDQADGSLY